MANRPRWWKENTVYSETKRTVDRQFLLRPCPETRNIIGACVGRALRMFPVQLHWVEANINHLQTGKSALPGKLDNMSKFDQLLHSLLSRELNRHLEREGPVWSSRNRVIECVDDEAAEDRLLYSMTNPVKDGLCERVKHWSRISFSAYPQLAEGKKEKFSYINRTAWHKAGGEASGKKIEDFTEWVEVEFTPLPHLEHLAPQKRESHLRRELREIEKAEREKRLQNGRHAMTQTRLLKTDPRQRPRTKKPRTRMPLCHASSHGARQEFEKSWYNFLNDHMAASGHFLGGKFTAEFPDGSFRPPLNSVCGTPMRC